MVSVVSGQWSVVRRRLSCCRITVQCYAPSSARATGPLPLTTTLTTDNDANHPRRRRRRSARAGCRPSICSTSAWSASTASRRAFAPGCWSTATAPCATAEAAARRGAARPVARAAARHPARHQGHLRRLRLADGGGVEAVGEQRRPPGRRRWCGGCARPGRCWSARR